MAADPLSLSFTAIAMVNVSFFDALIVMPSPVAGLRPSRSALSLTLNLPKPLSDSSSPLAAALPIASNTASTILRASVFEGSYLWLGKEARYSDWAWYDRKATPVLSSATLYPLFVGMASIGQARAVANTIRDKLIAPGGLRTTNLRTGQQWDAPNGWAPLQWVAIDGLERYGHKDLAHNIATRWIKTVEVTYHETGKMLEKYDVEEHLPGGGGEYPLQDGFGWTNGVASAILDRYPISTN